MKIDFDPAKRAWTLQHRGIDFDDANYVFAGPQFTFEDTRLDYGEPRFVTMGYLNARMVVVAWTPRDVGGTIVRRVISMRKANEREIEEVQERLR